MSPRSSSRSDSINAILFFAVSSFQSPFLRGMCPGELLFGVGVREDPKGNITLYRVAAFQLYPARRPRLQAALDYLRDLPSWLGGEAVLGPNPLCSGRTNHPRPTVWDSRPGRTRRRASRMRGTARVRGTKDAQGSSIRPYTRRRGNL